MADAPTPSGGESLDQQSNDALLGEAPLNPEDDMAPVGETPAGGGPAEGFSQEEVDALVEAAAEAPAGTDESADANPGAPVSVAPPAPAQSFAFAELDPASIAGIDAHRVSMLSDVKLNVRIELGRTRMLLEEVLKLGDGSVVELDRLAGDPVDVLVNGRLVARGEVLILNDNFCVRISEVVSKDPHRVAV